MAQQAFLLSLIKSAAALNTARNNFRHLFYFVAVAALGFYLSFSPKPILASFSCWSSPQLHSAAKTE
jgi:hypothetical protein